MRRCGIGNIYFRSQPLLTLHLLLLLLLLALALALVLVLALEPVALVVEMRAVTVARVLRMCAMLPVPMTLAAASLPSCAPRPRILSLRALRLLIVLDRLWCDSEG
jgi:hypothetical protein